MSLLANSNAIESGGYNIDRSLRFRSSASAYLNRTPASTGSVTTWTYNAWVKRGTLGATQSFFGAGDLSTTGTYIQFNSSDQIEIYYYSSAYIWRFITSAVYRDPSGWYAISLVYDSSNATAANRLRLYVNGVQVTAFGTSSTITQNQNTPINTNSFAHYISVSGSYFDGYLAEVNFIDGQALTPSSFGQTDPVTGVWTPKKYTGTYGTNGFYLPFSDNTSATTLAYDKSGNGNNWTPNNISTTAGATYDSMTDVPTLTSASAANYCVLNSTIWSIPTYSNGNLTVSLPAQTGTGAFAFGTIAIPASGKWYWEAQFVSGAVDWSAIGIKVNATPNPSGGNGANYAYLGNPYKEDAVSSTLSYGTRWSNGDIIGVAYSATDGTIEFFLNGTSQGVAFTGIDTSLQYFPYVRHWTNANTTIYNLNFGQRPFSYTPPTGFKALNTFNLPDPVIKKPNQYMDATTYTGNGASNTVVNTAGFQPDLVWTKGRSFGYYHQLYDSVRGVNRALYSNVTDAEFLDTNALMSFNSNGWTMDAEAGCNANGVTYVGWQWKKGATPGFDIVTYTGNATARDIAHNLGVAPKFIIVKDRSNTNPWPVYHASLGVQYYTLLNATDASYNNLANYWGSTAPTSSVFSVNTYGGNNANGDNFVAYLFAEIAGFSKFGSYTGNGSTDGPFVYCGFRPKYVMVKCSSTGGAGYSWFILDSSRDTYNVVGNYLLAQASDAEATTGVIDFTSNGFKLRFGGGGVNPSSQAMIFAAFAENPFKYSLAR